MRIWIFLCISVPLSFACSPVNQCSIASYTTTSNGAQLGIGALTNNITAVAQSFPGPSGSPVNAMSVTVSLMLAGTIPTGNYLTVTLENNQTISGVNQPNGVILASGIVQTTSLIQNVATTTKVSFASPAQLTSGNIYWIKMTPTYGASDTNLVYWMGHNGTPGDYSSGNAIEQTPLGFTTNYIGTFEDLYFNVGC